MKFFELGRDEVHIALVEVHDIEDLMRNKGVNYDHLIEIDRKLQELNQGLKSGKHKHSKHVENAVAQLLRLSEIETDKVRRHLEEAEEHLEEAMREETEESKA